MSGKHRSIGGSSVRSSAAKKSGRSNSPQAGEMAKGRGAAGAGAKPTPHSNHITAADLEQFAVSSLKKIISQRGFSASDLGRKNDIIAFIVGLKAFTREGDLPKFLQQYPTTNRLKRAREEQEVDGQKADLCAQDLVVAPGVKRRKDVAEGKILFGGSAAQEVVPAIHVPHGAQTKSEGQPVAAGKRKAKPSPATQKENGKSKRHPDPPSSQLPPKRVAASQQVSQNSVVFSQNQAHGTPARRPGKKRGEEGNFLSAQKQVAQTPLSVSKYKRRKLLDQLLGVPRSEHEGDRPAFNVEDYYFCTGCGGRMKKYVSSRCYGNVVYRFSCEHSFYESGNDKDEKAGAGLVPSFCRAKMMKTSADYARSKGCANHSMEEMLAFLEPLLCPTLRLEMETESSFRVYLVEEPPPEQTSTRTSSFRLLTGQRLLCELLRCGIAKDLLLDSRDAESFEVDDSEGNHHFAVEGQKKCLVFPLSEYERILELVEGELRDRVQHLLPLSWGAGGTTGLPTTTTTFISPSSSSSTSTMATSIGGGSLATCGAEHKVVNTKISTSGSGLPFQLQIEGIDPGVLKFFRSLGQTQVAAEETAERSSSAAEVESAIKRLRDLHMWDRVGIENASNEGCREEPLRGYQQAGVRWCLDQAQCASLALASDFASKWNAASSGTYVSTAATAGSLRPKPKAKRKTSGKTTKTSPAPPPPEDPKTESREQPLRLLLADEMGLGKTRQAIALLFAKKLFPSIIVVKAVTRLAWKMEIENFGKFGLESTKDVHLIQSADDAWHTNANLPMITVVSYHMAVNLMPQLMAKREKLLSCVVDEAHELRNASSGTSTSSTRATTYSTSMAGELLTFIRDIPNLLLLTGTPCANRVQDLRVLAGVLQAYGVSGPSTTSAAFLQDYLVKFEKASASLKNRMQVLPTSKQLTLPVSTTRSHELNLLLRSTIMLRRMKKDVVSELPALVETPVHVPIGRQTWRKVENQFRRIVGEPEERDELPGAAGREDFGEENTAAGDEASDAAKNGDIPSAAAEGKEKPQSSKRALEEFEVGRTQRAALAKLYEMRHWLRDLVIANTAAAADGVLEDGGPGDTGDKIHCTKNRKIVLFAHHKRVFDMVVEWVLRSQNVGQQGQHHEDGDSSSQNAAVIPYVRIDGDLDARGKQQQLELFTSQKNAEGAASVALVSMTAAGIGINGLEAASCCVFLELPDSPHWWLQCRARVDRFGQTGERVWFYYLIEAASPSAGGKRKLGIEGLQDAETDAAAGVESAEEAGVSGDESEGDEEDSDGGESGEDAGEKAGNADDGKDGNGQGRRLATERKNSSATTLDARRWAQLNRKVARIADVFDRPAATLATAARSVNSLGRSGNSPLPSSAAAREIRTTEHEPERDFAFELSDTNLVHVFYSLHHAEAPNTHTGLVYPLADLLLGAAEDVDTTECVESRTTSTRRAAPFALAQRFAAHLHDGKRTPTYVRARLIGTAIAFCDLEFVITNLRATRNVDHLGLHRGNDGNDASYCEKIHNRFAVPGKPSFTERRAFEALQRDESSVDKKDSSTLCWIPAEFPDPKFKTLTAFLAPYDAGKGVLYCANCVREIVCKPGSGRVVRRKKTAAVAGGQSQGRRGGSNLNSAQQVGRTQSEEVGGAETPQNTKPKRLLRRHMTTDEERARLERFIAEEFGDSSAEGPAQSSQRPTARTASVATSAEQQHQNSTVKVSLAFRAKLPCKNDLFCCGKCSTAYKMKRSGSKLRDVLFKHERGVCQTCLVDCEKVYLRLLQMARTESSRASSFSAGVAAGDEKIGCAAKIAGTAQLATASATSSTPQPTASGARKQYLEDVFRDTLALCIREKVKVSGYLRQILEAESVTAGMLWNCDHVREVRDGGGEAEDLSEIQTLCVFCHARKTMGHPSS